MMVYPVGTNNLTKILMKTMVLGSNEQYSLFFKRFFVIEKGSHDLNPNNTFHLGQSMYHDSKIMRNIQFDNIIFLEGFEDVYETDRIAFYKKMQAKCPEETHFQEWKIFRELISIEENAEKRRKSDVVHQLNIYLVNGSSPERMFQKYVKNIQMQKLDKTLKDLLPDFVIENQESCLWLKKGKVHYTLSYFDDLQMYGLFTVIGKIHTRYTSLDLVVSHLNSN